MDAPENAIQKAIEDGADLAERLKDTEDGQTVTALLELFRRANNGLNRQHAILSLALPIAQAAERYVAFKVKTAKQIQTAHLVAIEEQMIGNLVEVITRKNNTLARNQPQEKKSLIVSP